MLHCARGLPVSTDSQAAVDAIDGFIHALLAHTDTALVALDAPKADPDGVLANTAAAALMMFGETGQSAAMARPFLDRAFANEANATEREQLLLRAVDAWARNEIRRALGIHAMIAQHWPQDIFNVKLAQHHCFNKGDAAGLRRFAEDARPVEADEAYLQGMLAFGLEQTGDLRGAERAAREATEREELNPWAHHAVAHVLFTEDRHAETVDFLTSVSPVWEPCSTFMYTHNWWHAALAALKDGGADRALELYDERIWTRDIGQIQPQVNAASLLARLEMTGIDVGSRWEPVAEKSAEHIGDHVNGFLDLHFVTALAGAGREAETSAMMESLEACAAERARDGDLTWRYVVLPAARGIVAHARRDYSEAATQLDRAMPGLHEAGGSHAQRTLFSEMLADAKRKQAIAAA